ncbi:MAG: hypothetical protein M0P39_12575 [Rhodocyclaceae bacterium]|jgi:hypothetical protein|nr:hypothetical protein [Rhodocyclaceae bacterium]
MKRLLIATALIAVSVPALSADVGVSLSIGEPGFYGRLDIGDYPQPQLIYRRPVLIERVPAGRPPVYLRVPPGHAKNWRKHCRKYGACGEPVYFVQDSWYNREYVPRYRERQSDYREGRRNDHEDGRRSDHDNDRHGRKDGDRGRDRDH